jgi:hypothetical protein
MLLLSLVTVIATLGLPSCVAGTCAAATACKSNRLYAEALKTLQRSTSNHHLHLFFCCCSCLHELASLTVIPNYNLCVLGSCSLASGRLARRQAALL